MPINNHRSNPFVRGFNDLRIQRLLAVLFDAQAPLCHLPPHPSQQHLTDDQLARHPCLFNEQHALIVNSSAAMAAHEDSYPYPGIVAQVIYAVFSHDQSPPILVGDHYSEVLAKARIQQLAFETGHYSRCWEISTAHLPDSAWQDLTRAWSVVGRARRLRGDRRRHRQLRSGGGQTSAPPPCSGTRWG